MQRDADFRKGFFTLPGEAGYEELTLQLAEKWGADAIRDSDGTNCLKRLFPAAMIFTPRFALSEWITNGPRQTGISCSRLFS